MAIIKSIISWLFLFSLTFVSSSAHAGWTDQLLDILGGDESDENSVTDTVLSSAEIIEGLKQALQKGTGHAINTLGRNDGFFANPKVKIPMPDSLATVESALRKLRQEKLADEFVLTMNRAAEQAVPETADIFAEAIKQMSFSDAKSILNGPDDAATKYFRKTSGARLQQKILPIISEATGRTGVTKSYKNLLDEIGFMANFIDKDALDIDQYVTGKAIDGLFLMLAEEEKLIRRDPAARTTDLLKRVFVGAPD